MIENILNLLYPAFCLACSKKTRQWNRNICDDCLKKIKKRMPPFCIKCGREMPNELCLQEECSDCKKGHIYFDRALSVFYYDGALKELIQNFKYRKTISLAKEFVDIAAGFMEEYAVGEKADIVISVPMHPARLLTREINTSHILAKNIAKTLGIRYSSSLIRKIKNTVPQSRLARHERIKNIKGSFSLQRDKISHMRHENILIVDDLFTTGSTVNECARVLKDAGSKYVEVITLARGR